MKRFSKFQKISSLVLAFIMTALLVMPYMGTVEAADDTTGWRINCDSKVTGNAVDGWKVEVNGTGSLDADNKFTRYENVNCKVSDLRVIMDLSTMETGKEIHLGIGVNLSVYPNWQWDGSRVLFKLRRDSDNTLILQGRNNSAEFGKAIINFDFSKSHTFEFLKDDTDKWQLAIDGVIYKMGDTDGTSVDYFVNQMDQTQEPSAVKVGFLREWASTCVINNVKFETKEVVSDTTGWTINCDSKVTGNAVDGWKVEVNGTGSLDSNNKFTRYENVNCKVSDLRVIMDLSTMTDGQQIYYGVGKNLNVYPNWQWDGAKVIFRLERHDDTLTLLGHNGSEIGKTTINFDFSKAHTFEFLKDDADKWQLAIDGVIYKMGDTDGTSVDYFVNYMDKYISTSDVKVGFLRQYSTTCVVNNIKILPKIDVLGATIATQFEENVPVKVGFDYKTIKNHLGDETLVNYGAVLVSKEATSLDMQRALKGKLTQGESFSDTTYSDNKKFMFTVGGGTTIPDYYYVTIKNSDKLEYMDRNISAIGYIVTAETDGTYKYYFTTNTNASKNIKDGASSKSVTALLMIACEKYLEIYDAASNADRNTLEDVIAAFNSEYTVETLRTLITSGLAEAGTQEGNLQREFLKHVHLGARNGTPIVLNVADYGAVGDGITDDTQAVAKVLAVAQETQKKTLIVM